MKAATLLGRKSLCVLSTSLLLAGCFTPCLHAQSALSPGASVAPSPPVSPFSPDAPFADDTHFQSLAVPLVQTAPIPKPKRVFKFLGSSYAADQLLVQFKSGVTSNTTSAILTRHGLSVASQLPMLGWYVLSVPSNADALTLRSGLSNEADVEQVSLNAVLMPGATPTDPLFQSDQWQLHSNRMGLEAAWNRTIGNPNLIIAVCDSGIDESHEDLVSKITRTASGGLMGYNSVTQSSDPAQFADDNGHGTFVSGIAAAQTSFPGDGTTPLGIAGVNPLSRVLPIKITDNALGHSTDAEEAAGITYAASVPGVKVINASFQSNPALPATYTAIQQAAHSGILVVSIMGNINIGEVNPGKVYPGAYWLAMSVSATNYNDARTYYSNTYPGAQLQNSVAAPSGDPQLGINVWSTTAPGTNYGNSLYGNGYGTSFSAPHIAGLASLLADEFPTMSWSDLKARIEDTATNVNGAPGGRSDDLGWGRANADAATASQTQWTSHFPSGALFFSLPVWPSKVTLDPLDRSQDIARLFPGVQFSSTVFWWDPALGAYITYADSRTPRFGSGVGYFANFPNASSVTYTGASAFQNPNHPAVIHFTSQGYNTVGTPSINPIRWNTSTVKVRYAATDGTAVEVPLTDPSAATYIGSSILQFNPSTGVYTPVPNGGQIMPGQGYYILINKECDLLLPSQ